MTTPAPTAPASEPDGPELARLVSALVAANAVVSGADRSSVVAALEDLEDAWAKCPPEALDAFDRANIQLARSTLRHLLDLDRRDCLDDALRLARQLGPDPEDQRLLVQVLLEAANAARQAGDFDAARAMIDEAINRAETALGPRHEESIQARNCLGLWGRYRGEFGVAREAYTTALQALDVGSPPGMRANILHNLASLEVLAGRPQPALELIEIARALRPDDALGQEADDGVRAAILIDLARYPESDELFRSLSLRLSRRWGPDSAEMMHLNANWAVLEQRRGDLEAARRRYAQAISIAEQHGGADRPEAAVIYANAAHLALSCGDQHAARGYAQQALNGLEGRAAPDLPSLRLARQVRDALDS